MAANGPNVIAFGSAHIGTWHGHSYLEPLAMAEVSAGETFEQTSLTAAGSIAYLTGGKIPRFFRITGAVVEELAAPPFAGVLYARADGDLWLVTSELGVDSVQHFDGASWTAMGPSGASNGASRVMVLSANELFLLDQDETTFGQLIWRYSSGQWTMLPPTGDGAYVATLYHSGTNLFVSTLSFGASGTLRRLDGTQWTTLRSGSFAQSIFGADDDLYIADSDGNVLHFDGTTFSDVEALRGQRAFQILGSGPDNIFVLAIGGNGFVTFLWHFDGESWGKVRAEGDGIVASPVVTRDELLYLSDDLLWRLPTLPK